MIRILLFLVLVLFLGIGFSWFADRPGEILLEWQGNRYQTSLMVVLVGLVVLIAAIMITWWLARTILDSPQIVQRFFKARRQDQGYRALSRGLIAANSGDATGARKFTKESVRLLGREPLVDLLEAQSALLEGKREDAKQRFEEMLDDDETRLVALRGLYLEAERQGASIAARHYADQAHEEAPSLPWAGNAKLRFACMDGDWEGALSVVEANRSAGLIEKAAAKRQRAVLLTAQAMAQEPADPTKAAKSAREAHRLAPDLVPAAVIGAKALTRNNDIGRAAGMIESVWKKQPHPDLAAAYVHLRMGDSATDRLKRAKKLAAFRPNHVEGNFAIAEAAMDAQDWQLARDTLKSVLTTQPTERACLLMAEVEEGEFGDKGRMREWLSRAVHSPKDAAWTADGYVSDKWLPISPLTGRIDAFEWKVPVEQLGAPKAETLDADSLADLMQAPASEPEQPIAAEANSTLKDGVAGAAATVAAGEVIAVETDAGSDSGTEPDTGDVVTASSQADESQSVIEAEVVEVTPSEADNSVNGSGQADDKATTAPADDAGESGAETVETAKVDEATEPAKSKTPFGLDRRPDDPGVPEGVEAEKPKRFGIF